jgi:hypothetical protein
LSLPLHLSHWGATATATTTAITIATATATSNIDPQTSTANKERETERETDTETIWKEDPDHSLLTLPYCSPLLLYSSASQTNYFSQPSLLIVRSAAERLALIHSLLSSRLRCALIGTLIFLHCVRLGHFHALSLSINHYHYQPPSPSRQPCESALNDAELENHIFLVICVISKSYFRIAFHLNTFIVASTASIRTPRARHLRSPNLVPHRAATHDTTPLFLFRTASHRNPRLRPSGMLTSMNNGSRDEDGSAAHQAHPA